MPTSQTLVLKGFLLELHRIYPIFVTCYWVTGNSHPDSVTFKYLSKPLIHISYTFQTGAKVTGVVQI